MNSIFGGFDKAKEYYETNFWELENNDSLLFADLVRNRRLALLGTHDLIAHVAGLSGSTWQSLADHANRVLVAIQNYIGGTHSSIPDLVLPYTAGVILDDLAQPPSYQSASHQIMLETVLETMALLSASPNSVLLKYPSLFEDVIMLSRSKELTKEAAKDVVGRFVTQLHTHTARIA